MQFLTKIDGWLESGMLTGLTHSEKSKKKNRIIGKEVKTIWTSHNMVRADPALAAVWMWLNYKPKAKEDCILQTPEWPDPVTPITPKPKAWGWAGQTVYCNCACGTSNRQFKRGQQPWTGNMATTESWEFNQSDLVYLNLIHVLFHFLPSTV